MKGSHSNMNDFCKPSISVIIPSFNHGKYIRMSIQSVLDQTFTDYELLIADDGSKDDSWNVIKSFKDNRITAYKFDTNLGAAETVNFLIEKSNGKYIALLNSDDYWHKNKLQIQFDFMEQNPTYAACFTNVCLVNENSKTLGNKNLLGNLFINSNLERSQWLEKLFFKLNSLCHPSVMIKKDLYMRIGLYNPCFVQLPDYSMWINILKLAPIYVIDQKLTYFRITTSAKNTSRSTYDNIQRQNLELELILDSFFDNMSDEDFIKGFSRYFRKRGDHTRSELECEKAFMYFNNQGKRGFIYKSVGTRKLFRLFLDKNMSETLKNSYDFTYKDFRKLKSGREFWLDKFIANFKLFIRQNRLFSELIYRIITRKDVKKYDTKR